MTTSPTTLPAAASASALPDGALQPLSDGVFAIDTGFHREGFDAAYLLVERGRGMFVDTGTNPGVPRLLAALERAGLEPAQVDWVIPTHVHLDHAGGTGLLLRHLPNARVKMHPRGVRHLIDPSALYQGALAIYGQAEMDRSYGTLVPVDAARIDATADGETLEWQGRALTFIDAPGHARHHHAVWDARSRGWFTGDTFGLSYREFDLPGRGAWILPTSTPVQFEPDALKRTIDRLLGFDPQCMHLTHFGRVGDVARLASLLTRQIDAMVTGGLALRDAPDRPRRLKEMLAQAYEAGLREHGLDAAAAQAAVRDLLALDVELNAQGLAIWLDKAPR